MTRKYGIDLLKIVSMIMVVVLHIYGTGGVLERLFVDPHSLKNGISNVVHTFCMMAVDCFVLATGYIMCEHRFKYSRILKLWGTVVFYGLTMTSIAAICCPEIDIGCKNWLKAALPVGNDGYWFFTQYVALFFMIPFLNHLLKTLPGKQMHILLITGFALLSFYPSLCHADLFKVHLGYSFVWFMYLYVVAGYLAIYKVDWRINTKIVLLALGGGVVGSVVLSIISRAMYKATGFYGGTWSMYNSPDILLVAIAMLVLFSRLEINNVACRWIIGVIAPSVFSVYIIHSNGIFRKMVHWNGMFSSLAEGNAFLVPLKVLIAAVIVFIGCIAIDIVRRCLVSMIVKRIKIKG